LDAGAPAIGGGVTAAANHNQSCAVNLHLRGLPRKRTRRLRLHGFIERLPNSFRYRVTEFGFRASLFLTRTYNRLLRPGLAAVIPALGSGTNSLKAAFDKINQEIDTCIRQAAFVPLGT
jgi:hypothetical protein